MRRRNAVLVLAGLAAACADSGGRTTPSGDGSSGGTPPEEPLVRGTTLASEEIAVATRGAWTYRTAGASSSGGRGAKPGKAMGGVRHDLAMDAAAKGDDGAVTGGGGGGADGDREGRTGAAPPAASAPKPGVPEPDAGGGGGDEGGASGGEDRRLELLEAKSPVLKPGKGSARDRAAGIAEQPVARQLRAGATDDNADFAGFVQFLDDWQKRERMTGRFQPLDVRTRKFVRVVDSSGRPVPAARVAVVNEAKDRVVGRGTSYGDGRVPVYPRVGAADGDGLAPAGGWFVEVRLGDQVVRTRWDGAADEHVVTLGTTVAAPEIVPIDVAFLIDTTGSMGDEIASIQACLLRVTEQIRGLARETSLQCGTVLYRDVGDEYLTATHPLTADVGALDKALRDVRAGGGGDGPESLNQGLAETVDGLKWRDGAAKVVFLVADAPPHMDYAGDTPYGESARAAVAKGIRVHTVAASGIDDVGSLVFRQIAQYTRGKFVFIEYGGDMAKSGAAHGVSGAVKGNNLEDILFEQIRDEVARFGR